MADPKKALRDFLQGSNGVDTANISESFSTSDDIVVANREGGPQYPEIAIVSADPVVPGGGEMAVTAMDPGSGGAIQDAVYGVLVDCWAGTETTAEENSWSTHPDELATELAEETHQSCLTADTTQAPSNYEQISARPPSDNHDTEGSQVAYRQQVVCYLKTTHGP